MASSLHDLQMRSGRSKHQVDQGVFMHGCPNEAGRYLGRNMTWRFPRQKGKPSGLDDVVAHISELYYCVFLPGRSSSGEKKWGKPNSPWRSWNKPLHKKPGSNFLEVKRKDMLLHTWAFRSQKPEMTSVPKRRGNFGNVAKRRLVPLISKQFEVPRQKCFDWCCQDLEGWRTQKEKDRQRQKKSRAKKSLRRTTLRKLLEVRHAVQIWLERSAVCAGSGRSENEPKLQRGTYPGRGLDAAWRMSSSFWSRPKVESKTGLQGAINLFQPWFLAVSFGLK